MRASPYCCPYCEVPGGLTMKRRRNKPQPLTQLYLALCAVARDVASVDARSRAAALADSIPRTHDERYNSRHAELIRLARRFMRRLPDMPDDMLDDAAADARAFAAHIQGVMYAPRLRPATVQSEAA